MSFTSPPNPQQFNLRVWEIVRQIRQGHTYGRSGG
jgi:hypothetical protein